VILGSIAYHFKLEQLYITIGAFLGGMLAMEYVAKNPKECKKPNFF